MKIKTNKYIVYREGGKVYTTQMKYVRDLTDKQRIFVQEGRWTGKKDKDRLNELIDNDFKDIEIEGLTLGDAMEKLGFKKEDVDPLEVEKQFCNHRFNLLEVQDEQYVFNCVYCLEIKSKERFV